VRSSRASNRAGWLLALAATFVVGADVSAHRRDEYLQAARLAIDPAGVKVELDMTPGIAIADAIIADIDGNADGVLSPDEQRDYGRAVIAALDLEVDGTPVPVRLSAASFPDAGAMRRGEGTIRLHSVSTLPQQSLGSHRVLFRNRHHANGSVYLANALVPENDAVAVTAQRRDIDQREVTIDYRIRAAPPPPVRWILGGVAAASLLFALLMWSSRGEKRGQR
jgi:hypothetical protein